MDLGLRGQTVVVVGGSRGIGHAIAAEFAAEGANLAILDISSEAADSARQLTQQHGVQAIGLVCDATDHGAVQRAAVAIQQQLPRIEHVVFAVGIGSGKFGFPFLNLQPSDWPRVLEVNVQSAVHVAHVFAPLLIAQRAGTMLFLASIAGQIGSQTDPPYSASKAALINFAQCVAQDLAPHNVRVNALCPGMVKTVLNRAIWEAWARQQPAGTAQDYDQWAGEKIRKRIPLGRWQDAEDIAAMAVFLASARAKNITGQTINVDGGFVMHW